MQKRQIGQSGIAVSIMGLGTVKFGRNQGVKYPVAFTLPTDQEIVELLAHAKEWGINLLDTAPAYGISEERLGKLLGKNRHQWVISTKAGEEFINGESHYDFSPQAIKQSVERSLRRLKTDYVDVLLIHSNGEDVKIIQEETLFPVLEELKQSGKIRAYGVSTKTVAGGLLAVALSDLVMVTYHSDYVDERVVIERAHQLNKGIFVKKALASGHFTTSSISIADNLQFILTEPGVTSVIVGTLSPQHLRENVEAMGFDDF